MGKILLNNNNNNKWASEHCQEYIQHFGAWYFAQGNNINMNQTNSEQQIRNFLSLSIYIYINIHIYVYIYIYIYIYNLDTYISNNRVYMFCTATDNSTEYDISTKRCDVLPDTESFPANNCWCTLQLHTSMAVNMS